MAEPFLGEIRLFSFNFPPKGWALCNGQFLPINQNQALFSLLGTMFGGNGQTTFALPDFRGRCGMHQGAGFIQGQAGGQISHTLTLSEMPQHLHGLQGSGENADAPLIAGSMLGSFNNGYRAVSSLVALGATSVANVGGSQPHENMSPFLVISFGIALIGIFPSQN